MSAMMQTPNAENLTEVPCNFYKRSASFRLESAAKRAKRANSRGDGEEAFNILLGAMEEAQETLKKVNGYVDTVELEWNLEYMMGELDALNTDYEGTSRRIAIRMDGIVHDIRESPDLTNLLD